MGKSRKGKEKRTSIGGLGDSEGAEAREAQLREKRVLSALAATSLPASLAAERFLAFASNDPFQEEAGYELALNGPAGRAENLADAMLSVAPDSLVALTFAAGAAEAGKDDDRCVELYRKAVGLAPGEPRLKWSLGMSLLGAEGKLHEAAGIGFELVKGDPSDPNARDLLADAISEIGSRYRSNDPDDDCPCGDDLTYDQCCFKKEFDAVESFCDRSQLQALWFDLMRFSRDPQAEPLVGAARKRWFGVTENEPMEVAPDELCLFMGWSWTAVDVGDDDDEEEAGSSGEHGEAAPIDDNADDEFTEDSMMRRYALDPTTLPALAAIATDWLRYGRWGLWVVHGRRPNYGPGIYLTDILTGFSAYVAIPKDLRGLAVPWSVFAAELVPIGGVWHLVGAVAPMTPQEGEAAAEFVLERADIVTRHELDPQGLSIEDWPRPLSIGAHRRGWMTAVVGGLVRTVLDLCLPDLLDTVHEWRTSPPRLTNTDGETTLLLKVKGKADGEALANALRSHADFEESEDGFTWWGRQMNAMESAAAEEEVAKLAEEMGGSVTAGGPRRWVRGRIAVEGDSVSIDVNSAERRDSLLNLLDHLGHPVADVSEISVDPRQDFAFPDPPPIAVATESLYAEPSPGDEEDEFEFPSIPRTHKPAAWMKAWLDEKVPALAGMTPRQAARREEMRAQLEFLLRTFEYRSVLTGEGGTEFLREKLRL